MIGQPNLGALWASLLVEELIRQGVRHFVIAPGSRSTPLTAAAVAHGKARCRLVVDERAAGFCALGIARGSGVPAAVITTSGTAVVNLGPAVVEAAQDRVPLLLLTADRPQELRDCGANQTIAQPGLFAGSVRWSHDLPAPDDRLDARVVLTAAAQAYARAVQQRGPVHLNCAFREPLVPDAVPWNRACLRGTEAWQRGEQPFVRSVVPAAVDPAALDPLLEAIARARSGIVLAGSLAAGEAPAAQRLADALGWPLYASVRSGLRLGNPSPLHLPYADRLLAQARPDCVVQLGSRLTSKRVHDWLGSAELESYLLIDPAPDRLDPAHRAALRVLAPAGAACAALQARLPARSPFPARLAELDARLDAAVAQVLDAERALAEPAVVRWLSRAIPPEHALFVSSSLPIRWLQSFAARDGPPVRVAANRGASGIDGVLATAAGFALGLGQPVTLLVGDLALLHDLGSLWLLRDSEVPVVAVVLHNGGGGIFRQLPVAGHPELLTPWTDAAHQVGFGGVARDFGIAHRRVERLAELEQAYAEATGQGRSAIVEVACPPEATAACQVELEAEIARVLR